MLSRRRRVPYLFDHPLMNAWGVGPHTLAIDSMHCVDLGVASHVLGNCLYEAVYEQRGHGVTVKAAVANIWTRIQQIYDSQNTKHRISFNGWRHPRPRGSEYGIWSGAGYAVEYFGWGRREGDRGGGDAAGGGMGRGLVGCADFDGRAHVLHRRREDPLA